MEKIPLLDKDRLYLINLVKNNSLKYKTEIDYDKINGYIKTIEFQKVVDEKGVQIDQKQFLNVLLGKPYQLHR